MGNRNLVRWLGLALLLDGARSMLSIGGFAPWFFRALVAPRSRATTRPGPTSLARALGAVEALAGTWLLIKSPFPAAGLYRIIGRYYDYISLVWQRWLFRDAQAAIEDSLVRLLPPNGSVLDLGCGTAANLDRIASLGLPYGSYTGVDFSETMLAEATEKFAFMPNVCFHRLDLANDPLPQGEYNLVISTWALSHIPRQELVVEKAWYRLKAGGYMVLVDVSRPTTLLYPLLRPLVEFVAVNPLPPEFPGQLLGEKTIQRLSGGWTTLMVCRKPV